jgi:hypothetical protein
MRFESLVVVAVALGVATGCTSPMNDGVVCTAQLAPGILVHVVDSVSGALTASGGMAIAVEGAFRDSVSFSANASTSLSLPLAYERQGTYAVTVRTPVYATWLKTGVQVTKDVCHVNTVSLTAKLQPAP